MADPRLAERADPKRAALVVVDMQNDFCHGDGLLAKRGIDMGPTQAMTPALLKLIEAARAASMPILYTVNQHDRWTDSAAWRKRQGKDVHALARTGSWGADFYAVAPRDDERVVVKHRYNAFVGTDLDLILRSRGIESVLFSGVATNICVETTARDAFARNYEVVMVRDCLAGSSAAEHQATLSTLSRYFDAVVADAGELAAVWVGERKT
ncbi:MAG: cysteine hydrolase [Rhodospirillaceae bacterium]|nr:cysteine hydrolase [Rhodospirillaceae bacterium]